MLNLRSLLHCLDKFFFKLLRSKQASLYNKISTVPEAM